MKNAVMFTTLVLVTISPCVFASIEDMPDIDAYNWNLADDFSDLNYSLNNWDLDIPSDIRFGIDADNEYGHLKADYTYSTVFGEITPTQNSDAIGVRADIRLSALTMRSESASYCALGIDITPNASLYWGFTVLNGQLLGGNLLLYQNGSTSIIDGDAAFSATIGQTYNLAIVFDDSAKEYYLYLNGEKKTNVYFPDNETSFSSGHFRMYSRKTYSLVEFDNIEFATIPEPATMLLLALGGLIFRKHKFNRGEK